jgi:hypothetical protein
MKFEIGSAAGGAVAVEDAMALAPSRRGERQREAGHSNPATGVSHEERRRLIVETAYQRAKRRGFRGGDPLDDWLAAETVIDRRLGLRRD